MNLKSLLLKNIVCLLFFITMPFVLLGQNSNMDPLYSASENPASMTMDAPSAVPVLSPEEAREANEEALHIYRKQKLKGITTSMIKIIVGILLIAYFVYLHKKKKLKSSLLRFYHSPFGRMFYSTRFCHWDCFCILVVFGITFFFSMLTGENATRNGYNGGKSWYASAAGALAISLYNTGKPMSLVAEPDSKLDHFLREGSLGDTKYSSITNEEAIPQKYSGEYYFFESTGIAWLMAMWWKFVGHPDWSSLYVLFSLFYSLIVIAAYCALRQVSGMIPTTILSLLLSSYPLMMNQVLFGFRDGARALFSFIAIAIFLYLLKGGFRWKGTIVCGFFLFVICALSTYFRQDFIAFIPFIIIATVFFHGKVFSNYKKKTTIVLCILFGLILSHCLPGRSTRYEMGHVLYTGMGEYPYMGQLNFSADNYSKGIAYMDEYGYILFAAKAYREQGDLNVYRYTKKYDQECKKEISNIIKIFPYDFFRMALSSSIQILHLGSSWTGRRSVWIDAAPGYTYFQKLSKSFYQSIPSWLYLVLFVCAFILFLGGRFYQNILLCLAFMPVCAVYLFQFDLRHYFYLMLVSLLIAGFVSNRAIRIPFIALRNWKTVWSLCIHKRKVFMVHCSIFVGLLVLAICILFEANLIQTKQVKTEIENLNIAKTEEIQFQTNNIPSNIQRNIPATEVLLPGFNDRVLTEGDSKQMSFDEFLKVKVKVVDADSDEKIDVFAKYENTSEFAPLPLFVGAIIRSTWTCPIRMTFTIGKDTNTLFIPVYFTRNRSPFIGIEFFASGKKIEIQSVERIIETDKIRTQCAFLVPSQTNEMRYKGNIDWNEVFWGKDKLITVAP